MENNILSGGVQELTELIEHLDECERLQNQLEQLAGEKKQRQTELNKFQERIEAEVKKEIEKEITSITTEETQKIAKNEAEYKSIQRKRERQKNKGIRARIEEETKDFVTLERDYNKQIRRMLREHDLPLLCNSDFYFIMYIPGDMKEWCIRIVVLLGCLVLLPGLVFWIWNPFWLWKLLCWILTDAVILAIYLTIFLLTKDRDIGALDDVRDLREKLKDTRKKIRQITSEIRNDTDESGYSLEEFDEMLQKLGTEIKILTDQKEQKIRDFQENDASGVEQRVWESHGDELEAKKHQLQEIGQSYEQLNLTLAQKNDKTTEQYEKYIDTALLNKGKLEKLKDLLEQGRASDIQEAISIYDQKK